MTAAIAALSALLCLPALAGPAEKKREEEKVVEFHLARVVSRSDDAGAWRMLATSQVKLAEATGEPREYDRAWEALERAEALEAGSMDTLRGRARLLLSRHRFPQALALAESGLVSSPEDTGLLEIAVDAALEMGDLDASGVHAQKLHAISQQLGSWARLGFVAEARGKLPEALKHLEQALETGARKGAPPDSIAWCRAILGELHLKLGNRQDARSQYEFGFEKVADHPLVLEHSAELETLEGKIEAAERAYRKLLDQRPEPVLRLRLAEIVAQRGDQDGAAALRKESLAFLERVVGGGNEGYLRPLAELYLEAGRYPQAASLAARDLALRPNAYSRALLAKILAAAASAGKPVNSLH